MPAYIIFQVGSQVASTRDGCFECNQSYGLLLKVDVNTDKLELGNETCNAQISHRAQLFDFVSNFLALKMLISEKLKTNLSDQICYLFCTLCVFCSFKPLNFWEINLL